MKIEWEVEVREHYSGLLWFFVKRFRAFFKTKSYIEKSYHNLNFANKVLSYHIGEVILWHIDYKRLSHLELPKSLSPD